MTVGRLSDDTLATALICGGLAARGSSPDPLSLPKWNDLARRLLRAGWWPRDLLRWGVDAAREPLGLEDELANRLDGLLGQAVPVAAEIERLLASGIRVLSRADEDGYPSRWRSRLRDQSPPLVFVAGPVSLLERGGVAAVGSRDVDDAGAAFSRAVGRATACTGIPTISGGARGVDREAMFSALEAGGEAIGILSDGLARSLRSPDVRRAVSDGQLVLASPHHPNSRFEVWKAMGRNKLIYALADAAIVISSDAGRGGTWAGAIENLRHDWTPLFVRTGINVPIGNRQLIELGALPLDESALEGSCRCSLRDTLLERAGQRAKSSPENSIQPPLLDHDFIHIGFEPNSDLSDETPTDLSQPPRVHPDQLALGEEF